MEYKVERNKEKNKAKSSHERRATSHEIRFPPHRKYVERIGCAFCKGVGKDPFETVSVCPVCHGMKEHYILKPFSTCAYCKGTGIEFGTQNTCLSCHGKGKISNHKGKRKVCDVCCGSGMEQETKLTCHSCHGSGIL